MVVLLVTRLEVSFKHNRLETAIAVRTDDVACTLVNLLILPQDVI